MAEGRRPRPLAAVSSATRRAQHRAACGVLTGFGCACYGLFVCALALAWPDGHVEAFEGRVDGTIIWPPRGDKGFGYDPMFQPHGHAISFGEMDPDKKHAMSHRADAFAQLVKAVF